jgi:hypothetical protein
MGIVLIIELAIFVVASGIYYLVNSIRTCYLYVSDGADPRSVAIACFSPIYILAAIMGFRSVLTGVISAEIDIFIILTYLAFLTQLLRGRLLGYPSTRIRINVKNILFILTCVLSLVSIIGTIVCYKTNTGFTIENLSYSNISKTVFSFLSITFLAPLTLLIFTLVPSLIYTIMILYFDWKERRSKKTLFQDRLLFIPIIVHIMYNLIPYNSITGTIAHFAFQIIVLIVFIHMKDEFESIFRLARGVNSKIASCNKLVEVLSRKKTYSRNDLIKINFIAEQLKKDKSLKDVVLNKSHIFSPRRRKVIKKIKESLG